MSHAGSRQLVLCCLFRIVCAPRCARSIYGSGHTNILLSFSISTFRSDCLQPVFLNYLKILWKQKSSLPPTHPPAISADPHLQQHLYGSLSSSLFFDLPRYLALSLSSFHVALDLRRDSGGGSGVAGLGEGVGPREAGNQNKGQQPTASAPQPSSPQSAHTKHPDLASPPFLPSASCFHTRPRLYPLSLLRIHGKKLPFSLSHRGQFQLPF